MVGFECLDRTLASSRRHVHVVMGCDVYGVIYECLLTVCNYEDWNMSQSVLEVDVVHFMVASHFFVVPYVADVAWPAVHLQAWDLLKSVNSG